MESSDAPRWKPDPYALRWALYAVIYLPLILGITGVLALVLSSYDIAADGIIIGLLVAAATMAGFFQAVGESKSIPPSTKRQLRRNVGFLAQ